MECCWRDLAACLPVLSINLMARIILSLMADDEDGEPPAWVVLGLREAAGSFAAEHGRPPTQNEMAHLARTLAPQRGDDGSDDGSDDSDL